MIPAQAGELLLLMQATWPRLAPDEVSARLWVSDLSERCDNGPAIDAFRALRDSEVHAPSWATFLEAYNNASKSSRHLPPALPAPKEPKADPARLSALLQRAHAALTRPI